MASSLAGLLLVAADSGSWLMAGLATRLINRMPDYSRYATEYNAAGAATNAVKLRRIQTPPSRSPAPVILSGRVPYIHTL